MTIPFSIMPAGTVVAFAGVIQEADSPTGITIDFINAQGWLVCDGSELSIDAYPRLFASLGNTYGGYEYQRTFCLPDYRGMFLRGISGDSNNDPDQHLRTAAPGGTETGVGSTQKDALQNHTHQYQTFEGINSSREGGPASVNYFKVNENTSGPEDIYGEKVNTGRETRPKNIYVTYLIWAGEMNKPETT